MNKEILALQRGILMMITWPLVAAGIVALTAMFLPVIIPG